MLLSSSMICSACSACTRTSIVECEKKVAKASNNENAHCGDSYSGDKKEVLHTVEIHNRIPQTKTPYLRNVGRVETDEETVSISSVGSLLRVTPHHPYSTTYLCDLLPMASNT